MLIQKNGYHAVYIISFIVTLFSTMFWNFRGLPWSLVFNLLQFGHMNTSGASLWVMGVLYNGHTLVENLLHHVGAQPH